MTHLYLFCLMIFSVFSSRAITLDVVDEEGQYLFQHYNTSTYLPATVGELTIAIFENAKVPFVGNQMGMHEIFEIGNTVETLGKGEIKAWGWCFSIDGLTLETLTNNTVVTDQNSHIEWYYGYAHYKNGEWLNQCVKPFRSKE